MGLFDFFKRKRQAAPDCQTDNPTNSLQTVSAKVKVPLEEAIKITINAKDDELFESFSYIKHKFMLDGEEPPAFVEMDSERYEKDLAIHNKHLEDERRLFQTASLNNQGIALEKEGKIDEAIDVYEQNIVLGYKATHSFDRLRILYRKRKDYENMARVIKREGEVFGYTQEEVDEKINRYLDKKDKPKVDVIFPDKPRRVTVEGETLEDRKKSIIDKLPEFEFYTKLEHDQWHIIPFEESQKLAAIRDEIKSKIDLGAEHERHGRLDLAAQIYEELVANHVHNTKPYDRLIMIYKRAKLFDDARDVLEFSINFFRSLKQNQYKYIHYLADKYGVSEIHGVPIDEYGKIYYYAGVFELYNPYPIIEKWEKQLESLKN